MMSRAEQPARAAFGQDVLQMIAQIDIFAAQIDQPFARADRPRGDGHALDQQMRPFGQQHPVLEGARLAFVGVADDEAPLGAVSAAAKRHLRPVVKPAPPQPRRPLASIDVDDLLGRSAPSRLASPASSRHRAQQHRAGMPDVVFDHAASRARCGVSAVEAGLDDLFGRLPGLQRRARSRARCPRVRRVDHDIVDHRRRRLIAHADAGRVFQRERAVGRGLAELDAQFRLEDRDNLGKPGEAVDDVVAKPDRDRGPSGVSDRKE